MAVNINNVYTRVQSIANKEQRGYLTPIEYNRFANQAQLEIFEQYFYDLDQYLRRPGNDTRHADTVTSLQEKIALFEVFETNLGNYNSGYDLPTTLHKLSTVELSHSDIDSTGANYHEVEGVTKKDFRLIRTSNILLPTDTKPIYIREGNKIKVYKGKATTPFFEELTINEAITVDFIKQPATVNWAFYLDANNDALYNATGSTNFELHGSEEPTLVIKILELAGVAMKSTDVYQIGDKENIEDIQQQKG
tara:strand:- start:476 stop:1225 length:750 start_codon:yes stop_codon:yes gene_type:complete